MRIEVTAEFVQHVVSIANAIAGHRRAN